MENAMGAAEAIDFRRLGAEVEAEVDGDFAVLEESGVNVGHVAAVFPAEDAAAGEDALGRLVDAEHEHHAADKMNEKIAGDSRAVFLPAAPTCEMLRRHVGIPGVWGLGALPGSPTQRSRRASEGRR